MMIHRKSNTRKKGGENSEKGVETERKLLQLLQKQSPPISSSKVFQALAKSAFASLELYA